MRRYNLDEARLQAWKRKLQNIKDGQELITIIDSQESFYFRSAIFNERKKKLLEEIQEQDWPWTGFLDAIWFFISSLLPASWLAPSNPSLREILENEISIESFEPISQENRLAPESNQVLSDDDYVNALFTNPQLAFGDIQNRINGLGKTSDLPNILERLYAIKNHLTLDTYQTLLTKVFKINPVEALNYYYERYSEDIPDLALEPAEFIEHELMSRTIMDLFILPLDTDPMNQRLYAVQELLVVLALSAEENLSFNTFLNEKVEKGTKVSKLPSLLSSFYGENKPDGAKAQVINLLPEKVRQQGLKIPTFGNICSPAFDTPINLLKEVIRNPKSFNSNTFRSQPLFIHLARLACQEFILNYSQLPNEQGNHQLHETIQFLSEEILGTWTEAQKERKRFGKAFTPRECEAILSPFSVRAKVPHQYERAMFYANQIATISMYSAFDQDIEKNVLEKTRKIAASLHASNAVNPKPLSPHELAWILKVIERIEPNGSEIAKKVEYIFTEILVYGINDLSAIDPTPSSNSTAVLMQQMLADLKIAEEAFNQQQADNENQAILRVVTAFNSLLEHYEIDSTEQLQTIYDSVYKPLSNKYLTEDLAKDWSTALTKKHKPITVWSEVCLQISQKPSSQKKDFLEEVSRACSDAINANSQGQFMKEIEYSQEAVYYFSLYMNEASTGAYSGLALQQSQKFLEGELKGYLKPEQYVKWQTELQHLRREEIDKPSPGIATTPDRFFGAKDNKLASKEPQGQDQLRNSDLY